MKAAEAQKWPSAYAFAATASYKMGDLAKKNGGHTIAVYNPANAHSEVTCVKLLRANREARQKKP